MSGHIILKWFNKKPNWGDALNPILVELISGKKALQVTDTLKQIHYIVIGSSLAGCRPTSIVWGAGFMRSNAKTFGKPKKLYAVRGKLSRNRLLQLGYICPEIYGDPALLYPRYYNPKIEKKYLFGIVPHYIDKKVSWINKISNHPKVKIINILDDINKVVNDIKSCELIFSSSLHGIIAGDAYSIPSYWIKLSDKIRGDGFKYHDYFSSVEREIKRFDVNITTTLKQLLQFVYDYEIKIDLNKLYNACPFKK